MSGRPKLDIAGKQFGNLIVIEPGYRLGKNLYWECKCNCGKICFAPGSDLMRGRSNYCKSCVEKISQDSIFNRLLYAYKRAAQLRDLNFDLSIEDFKILISGNCYYCGVEPRQICKKKDWKYILIYNGIDRVNNKEGYIINNCVSCCKFCNIVKHKFSLEEFKDWIERIKTLPLLT